jgi:RimJ/RimL family protein N-acetyltransferase
MLHDSALITRRLIVRPFVFEDVEPLVSLFADPKVHAFVDDGRPLPAPVARLWIERSRENLARFGYGTGAVTERETGLLIGWAGFARPGDGSEEIVYGLAPVYWGRGLGRELVQGLLDVAKDKNVNPVRATVDPRNAASIAVLIGLGFALAERGYGGDAGTDLYVLG